MNANYIVDKLEELLNIPSPTGYCHHIMDALSEMVKDLGYSMSLTNKGAGVITIEGEDPSYHIGVSAHVDTLGAMVRSIRDIGTLRFTSLGGFMMGSVENEYCQIHTRSGKVYEGTILTTRPSVHVYMDARDLKREEENMEVRIDELVSSKQETEALGIRVGDFISFDPRFKRYENGLIKARHLDDKAAVAAVLGWLEWMSRTKKKPKHTVTVFIPTYEEVGHGASYLPPGIDELIAIDLGAMGEDLSGKERDVSICAKDATGPYDYEMTSRFIELAEKLNIGYNIDIYPRYGSDASAALRGGNDIRAALIGPGVHASHSMERTHMDAIVGTAKLVAGYVMKDEDLPDA